MIRTFIFALTMFVVCAQASATESLPVIKNAYAYETAASQKTGAVFLEIRNTGAEPLWLEGVTAEIAETTQLHTNDMTDGIMKMREVDAYEIPAGGRLTLAPTGHHIMLMNLKATLMRNTLFPLILHFKDRAPIPVEVTVRALSTSTGKTP
ncbi:MAG: copper chaperone PCu(A)C [Alphaproteobacteria bacterium]|nr:copper chaperone PCu(A)C [Alphaproteobacteria bacterium]